jgi:hypothetical protein
MMNRRELAELASKTDDNQTKLALQADANLASLGARRTRAIRAFFDAMTPPKPKKPRRASLKRLANVAKRQGVAVTVTRDGAVTVSPNLNAEASSTEWDEALAPKQK